MRRMTYFVMAFALVLGLSQCKKEQPLEPENETKTVNITLKVGGNGGSRHTIDTENGDVDFQDGDVVYVGNGSTYIGTLTKSGAVFSGNINEPADETEIYFFFVGGFGPSPNDLTQGTTPSFTVDISDQSTKMPVLSCNHVTYYSGTTSYSCVLQNQCALVKFTTASTTDSVHVGGLYTEAMIDFDNNSITNNGITGFVNLHPDAEDNEAKWAVLLPQTGFEGAEAAIAHVGYTATIPTIEADGFITGDSAISISTPNNIVYLDWITSGYTATDGQTLKGTLSGNYQISIASGATVTLRNANITSLTDADYAGITCDNDATIILEGTNTVVGGLSGGWGDYPGIFIAEDHTLTIDGTGTLYAKCGALDEGYGGDACGIGGGYDLHCGNINIQGGTIIATGGEFHAGIGGGDTEENDDAIRCGDITISGGTVTATGGENAAGIGSGNQGSCGDITISGGTVTAIGGKNAAGIGSGSSGTCGDIKINDGTVTATGGADATGIGSGGSGSCGDISISGGTVTATGGANAAGIGSGYIGTCGDITITSGVTRVTATKGTGASNSIGAGRNGYCGTVEIGGTVYWDLKDGSTDEYEYKNGGDTYLTQSPLIYPTPTPSAPTGAINGLFTINADGDQVWFSQGNLQYIGSTATPYWKFADNQWDYLGNNGQDSDSETANRDLFGWGTSGYNHGAVAYQPWSTSTSSNDYYAYGAYTNNLYDQTGQADWGYNAISNGGNVENCGWRTLTKDEWEYLFNNHINGRTTLTDVNVPGWMILPDGASGSIATSYSTSTLPAGALFLPAAGYRDGTVVFDGGGSYWSSTPDDDVNARSVYFDDNVDPGFYDWLYSGLSVRLVRNAK